MLPNLDDVADFKNLQLALKLGSEYLHLRFQAHQARLAGKIELARAIEIVMDKVYNDIPTEYQW